MIAPTTIFITYNPNVAPEQTLAIRLHTIGAVNGFRMYLPDRYNSDSILDAETQRRINLSGYMVFFSLGMLSPIVKAEINYAFQHLQDKTKIIVIYDSRKGKNLVGDVTELFTSFYFDPTKDNQEHLLHDIMNIIFQKNQEKSPKIEKSTAQGIAALLGIGLGLFILGSLTEEEKPKRRKAIK
jgi:hypothetical protein